MKSSGTELGDLQFPGLTVLRLEGVNNLGQNALLMYSPPTKMKIHRKLCCGKEKSTVSVEM